MIIKFSVKNWMSFNDEVSFSMVASREQQRSDQIPQVKKFPIKILPIAAIYGGNAAGKSNFFKALAFIKNFVLKGSQPDDSISVEPFLLDSKNIHEPCRFSLEILIDEIIYAFSFSVTSQQVVEEKLVKIVSSSETILYHRNNGKPNFDESLADQARLGFVFEGTRDNQLLLTNAISQKVDAFRPVYDWFSNTLILIDPNSSFGPFDRLLDENSSLHSKMNRMLQQLDTGITHLGGEKIALENIPLPNDAKDKILSDLKEGQTIRLTVNPINERFAITKKEGKLIAKKLVTFHSKKDGSEIHFKISQESSGSQRLIDLLPAFLELSSETINKVYVIDEIDRSLHTLLIRKLLEAYLDCCNERSRSQLLFTTYDVLLMDQDLLRRDEIWVTERDNAGTSTLFSFSEYKDIRKDKDIRKSYLQSRLGGVPRIFLDSLLEE